MQPFGRYRLVRRVGAGGMAEIWKARVDGPAGFEKTVAIKRILPQFEEDREFVDMFISEARLAARLVHPNIVQVHDFGLEEDAGQTVHYIAMEYVAGQNASTLMRRLTEKGARLPLGIALHVCMEAAKALAYAHNETDGAGRPLGFVHRDISPHNLMITYRGDVKVADFGIAKAATAIRQTAAGVFKGKVTYMSPEQARAAPLDGRSDLFSLGIVLYELVTGKRLFGGTIEEVFAQIRRFRPPGADKLRDVPEDVQRIVRTALAVDPDERYQDAAEMETELARAIAAGGWVTARADLAGLMHAQFAREIELERKDAAPPPDRPKTAILTDPGLASDGGTATPRAAEGEAGGLGVSGATPVAGSAPAMATPVAAPDGSAPSLRQESVRVVERTVPSTRGRSRGALLLIAALAGAVVPVALWRLGVLGGASPAAAPSPAPIAEGPATSAPVETALVLARTPVSPTPEPSRTPRPRPTPARTAMVSASTPVAPPGTPRPTPAAAGRGWVTITARPWVRVWIDGTFVADETPLRRHALSAGAHTFRFENEKASFRKEWSYTVAADREVEIRVDTATGNVAVY